MNISAKDWMLFLRDSDGVIGLPLAAAGAILVFFGWRMWKVCVVASFGLIGAGLTSALCDNFPDRWLLVVAGGIVLGGLSYFPSNYSIAILGGSIGGTVALDLLSDLRLHEGIFWSVGIAAFLGSLAYAFINRQMVVIIVTAILGSVLLMSGLAVLIMASPSLYGTIVSMARGNVLVVPFMLLVPTVMSCFYQVAEVRRFRAEL